MKKHCLNRHDAPFDKRLLVFCSFELRIFKQVTAFFQRLMQALCHLSPAIGAQMCKFRFQLAHAFARQIGNVFGEILLAHILCFYPDSILGI